MNYLITLTITIFLYLTMLFVKYTTHCEGILKLLIL